MDREVRIFISYNHHSEAITKTLADDIKSLGYTVWFDQELKGGQTWWNEILIKIRECDVFIFMLDATTLNSTACKREYSYAADLGKSILPILIAEDMSSNLLPPALSQIQFVDYRKQDRTAVLRLARALITVPPPKLLPDPLPLPPEVPISYIGRLAEQIETSSFLDYEKQSALVVDLKGSLRDPEIAEDVPALLRRLRKRRDLFVPIAEEIDELFESIGKASSVPPQQPEGETQAASISRSNTVDLHERRRGALIGALLGWFLMVIIISISQKNFNENSLLLSTVIGIPVGSTLNVFAVEIRQVIRKRRSKNKAS